MKKDNAIFKLIKEENTANEIRFFNYLKSINQGRVYTVAKIKQRVSLSNLVVGNYYLASESVGSTTEQLELCKLLAVEWTMDSKKVILLFSKPEGKRFNLSSYTVNINNIEVYNEIFDISFIDTNNIDFAKLNDKDRFVLSIKDNGRISCIRKIKK